jgi:hypothetical protein
MPLGLVRLIAVATFASAADKDALACKDVLAASCAIGALSESAPRSASVDGVSARKIAAAGNLASGLARKAACHEGGGMDAVVVETGAHADLPAV